MTAHLDLAAGPWVALVGAGPGDPGLLTRRAEELLRAADVVLYDWLAGTEILDLANPSAELVDVGKAKGAGCRQDVIEALIVAHAAAGRRVVRLKGGDPFLFGRGMEEARTATAAGFEVEVVPGVSSALSAPALAGIAVTERGRSAQVTIVSGHRASGSTDWAALADTPGTLVVLMGASTGVDMARGLIAAGKDAATPVAVVVSASRPEQVVWRTDLADLADWPGSLPGPCVIVVGAVAANASCTPVVARMPPQTAENQDCGVSAGRGTA